MCCSTPNLILRRINAEKGSPASNHFPQLIFRNRKKKGVENVRLIDQKKADAFTKRRDQESYGEGMKKQNLIQMGRLHLLQDVAQNFAQVNES